RGFPIFDALITENTKTGVAVYRIAQSLTTTDAINWTMKLRPGVKFSDNTTLDADAVKLNYERTADPANKSPKAGTAQSIASMTVVDPTTLRMTIKAADAFWPIRIAEDLPYIVSPAQIKADPTKIATAPIGAGAYMVKEWVRNDHTLLVRNP